MGTATIERSVLGLADRLIIEEGRGETPFGTYLVPTEHPAAGLARALERQVFFEVFGNSPKLLADEYDPYEDASVFLCVLDHVRHQIAGAIRFIMPSPAGFKSLLDIESTWHEPLDAVLDRSPFALDLDRTWDLATLVVAPDYRGEATDGLITTALFQGLAQMFKRFDIRQLVAIMDVVVLDSIQSRYHRPLSKFAGLAPATYLDSPASLPVMCDMPDFEQRLALIDPVMWELGFLGRGMEAVVSQPDWDNEHRARPPLRVAAAV
jgi:hypothetical protein